MSKNLSLTVRQLAPGTNVIDVQGDITGQAEEALQAAYEQASQDKARAIILNLGGLDYMNSSGIGLLVTMLIRTQREKQKLLAYGLTTHYQEIFALTRLNEAIGIYDSEAAALTAVATPA
ncbi:MAG: STAS domain-containing protein [Anaerolineales bacterium]|nr:STAS domain-containing protein [Anaerolineales bacterium]